MDATAVTIRRVLALFEVAIAISSLWAGFKFPMPHALWMFAAASVSFVAAWVTWPNPEDYDSGPPLDKDKLLAQFKEELREKKDD